MYLNNMSTNTVKNEKMSEAQLLIHSLLGMVVGETGGQTSDLRLEDEMEITCKIRNVRPAR